jgi:hypothetical protein
MTKNASGGGAGVARRAADARVGHPPAWVRFLQTLSPSRARREAR